MAKARLAMKKAEAEAKCLKEALEKVEALQEEAVASRVKVEADLPQKGRGVKRRRRRLPRWRRRWRVKSLRWAIWRWKPSIHHKFSDEKVKFGEEAFIVRQESCHQKISGRFPELDLSILDEEEADEDEPLSEPLATEEQPQPEPMFVEVQSYVEPMVIRETPSPMLAAAMEIAQPAVDAPTGSSIDPQHKSSRCRFWRCLAIHDCVESLPKSLAQSIGVQVGVSKGEVRETKKRAIKAEQRALERERACTEAFIEVKRLREEIKQVDKRFALERARLAEACARLAKTVEEVKWGAMEKVARL
ncbi:uncharacterized protein [Elaeis guineensis]